MRILYFLSALVLAVVLIVGCTGDPQGVVDPVNTTGLVPPPPPDPCNFNPCLNGGECTNLNDGMGGYTCTCALGYTGDNCEHDIDECQANPCGNGDCSDGINQATCTCEPGWTGANCTNGQCQPDGNGGFVCTCEGIADTGTMCNEPAVTDADGDGVNDDSDNCANTASGEVVDATGCSIAQYCPCIPNPLLNEDDWRNHGDYVSCVAHNAENFVTAGLITSAQKDAIVSAAGQSSCGKKK